MPLNPNSDSLSIDGTCMVIFDDDLLGNNQPNFRAEITTPLINISGYSTVDLMLDLHFRQYSTSFFEIFLKTSDELISLAKYTEGFQTGEQFSQSLAFSNDIRFLTQDSLVSFVFVYDDAEMYAWWAGIDNVRVVGINGGNIVMSEDFNECTIPNGWTTEILAGDDDWQVGLVDNGNASSNSMNGTCFFYFDDDGLGDEAKFSSAALISPIFDGSQYANFTLNFDLIFRKYGDFENISVYISDGENQELVKAFVEPVGGNQFYEYEKISLDLSPYRSNEMQIIFLYEDGNTWGWWTGIDNVKIVGFGEINDLCSKAIPLVVGEQCMEIMNQTAVFDGPQPSCISNADRSIWYTFNAALSGILQLTNKSNFNDQINIFTGTCDELVEIHCGNKDEHGFEGESIEISTNLGQDYFVRISGLDTDFGESYGTSCLSAKWVSDYSLIPINDILEDAIKLNENNPCITLKSIDANTENVLPSENNRARSDIWLSFTPVEAGDYKLNTESDFSDVITLYSMEESELTELASNIYGKQLVMIDMEAGKPYFIQLAGIFSTIEGNGCVSVESIIIENPENEDCLIAKPLSIGTEEVSNNYGATFSGINSSCAIYTDADIWYEINTLDNNTLYFVGEADFPYTATIYEGECDGLVSVWCNKNMDKCESPSIITGLEANSIYYLQISSNYTDNELQRGYVSFTVSDEIDDDFTPLSLSIKQTCIDGLSASLEILVSGGDGDYTFLGNSDSDIIGTGEEYLVILKDGAGCEVSKSGLIDCQPSSCNLSVSTQYANISCSGESLGYISLEPLNGQEPFQYLWSVNGLEGSEQSELTSGIYQVTISDVNQCVVMTTIEITEPDPLLLGLSVSDESMGNGNDGMAYVNPNGGTYPYQISWSTGQTGSEINNLSPGNYSVSVTDFNGCQQVKNFMIAEFDCAFVLENETIEPSCHDSSDGSISISSEVGILQADWDNGMEGITIDNLESGIYTVMITADNGCKNDFTFELGGPQEIIITEENLENVSCFGLSDGIVDLNLTGGTGVLDLLWPDGNTSLNRNDLPAGSYVVQSTDENGCISSEKITISEPAELTQASQMVMNVTCNGDQNGAICVFIEGGTMPYDFDWGDAHPALSKIENLSGGEYPLIVIDSNECLYETLVLVTEPDVLELSIDEIITANGSIQITPIGGTPPYIFNWIMNGDIVNTDEDPIGLEAGNYTLEMTDNNGCSFVSDEIILSTSSTSDILADDFAVISPNPAKDFINLSLLENAVFEGVLEILDINGKVIVHENTRINSSIIIDVNKLASGNYILVLNSNGKLRSLPFVKID
jgi:hypothetical protein